MQCFVVTLSVPTHYFVLILCTLTWPYYMHIALCRDIVPPISFLAYLKISTCFLWWIYIPIYIVTWWFTYTVFCDGFLYLHTVLWWYYILTHTVLWWHFDCHLHISWRRCTPFEIDCSTSSRHTHTLWCWMTACWHTSHGCSVSGHNNFL